MLKHKILIVDDDERLLKSFKRILSNKFSVTTAESGASALELLDADDPFSIVISDYKMPEMNGVDFLAEVNKRAPDTMRILLTGYAELNVALDAVNEGNIFRILQKPCPPKTLAKALLDALRYYEMAASRRELMENTIQQSIAVLGDLISLINPDIYGRISRITPHVRHICREINPHGIWEAVTAARLSMIGFVTLPEKIIQKDLIGAKLLPKEQVLFNQHPTFSATFIEKIPGMGEVARTIAYQEKCYDGSGYPVDAVKGDEIPVGARILKACLDLDRHVNAGMSFGEALNALASVEGCYDPEILGYLFDTLGDCPPEDEMLIYINGLEPGMIIKEDIYATRGDKTVKLIAAGQELSEMSIAYLERMSLNHKIPERLKITTTNYCKL